MKYWSPIKKGLTKEQQEKLSFEIGEIERIIQEATDGALNESEAEMRARLARYLKPGGFGEFAKFFFPHIIKQPLAAFHLWLAKELVKKNSFVVAMFARSLAKTTVGRIVVIWMVARGDANFIIMASSSQEKAIRLLGEVKAEFATNRLLKRYLSASPRMGQWQEGSFVIDLEDGMRQVKFVAYGKKQNPRGEQFRGRRPDLIWLDDIDDDEEARNPKRLTNSYDWIMGALYAAGDTGNVRMLAVNNIIAQESLIVRLAQVAGAASKTVNLVDKDGKSVWSRYTDEECQLMIERLGYHLAQREYFNNPIIQGDVFRREWINYAKVPRLKDITDIVAYYDPSISQTGDYKAVAVLGYSNGKMYVLDFFCRKSKEMEAVRWLYDLAERYKSKGRTVMLWAEGNMAQKKLQQPHFEMEGKRRGYNLELRWDERKKIDKAARIITSSVYYERGDLLWSNDHKESNDFKAAIEQILAFGEGSRAHDDAPDAIEGAIEKLKRAAKRSRGPIQYRTNDLSLR